MALLEPDSPPVPTNPLTALRWSKDNQGLPALVERLTRRSLALTDDQVVAIQDALAAREEARR